VNVDLLPATNFVKGQQQGGGDMALLQKQGAMKDIEEKKNTRPECQTWYAGGLTESQIGYMKAQSSFTHELVRLVKYWYKTLYLGPRSIYGMKLMLEIIAVNVSNKMKGQPESWTAAFREFLTQVSQIDNGVINLVDPNNPYNNLAENFKDRGTELKNLKEFAAATAKKLSNNNGDLLEIFQATPPKLPTTITFVTSFTTGPQKCKFNQYMTVRNEEKRKKLQDSDIAAIKIFLVATINTAAASIVARGQQRMTQRGVEDAVEQQLQKNGKWMKANAKHEDCDLTFVFPVTQHEDLGALQVSLRV